MLRGVLIRQSRRYRKDAPSCVPVRKDSTSPFEAFRMLLSDCCNLDEFSSARAPLSMSANSGSIDVGASTSIRVRAKTLEGRYEGFRVGLPNDVACRKG